MFNEIHYRVDKSMVKIDGIEILRKALRAVIINGDKILMAHLGKTNEYKFPGGGQNVNETIEDTLRREVLEEIGYKVIKIHEKIGSIIEYSTSKEGEEYYFKMISDYYLVDIENVQLKQKLEKDEEEFMYKPCWVDIKKAYKTNKELIHNKNYTTPGINRETIALEKIIEGYKL